MDAAARARIAFAALLAGAALIMAGLFAGGDDGQLAMITGSGFVGSVLGYTFGTQTSEHRAATSLAEHGLDANTIEALRDAIFATRPPNDVEHGDAP